MPPQILAVQQHLQKKPHRRESKSPEPPPPPFITDEQNAESWNNLKVSYRVVGNVKPFIHQKMFEKNLVRINYWDQC